MQIAENGQTLINRGLRQLNEEALRAPVINHEAQDYDLSAVCHEFFANTGVYSVVGEIATEEAVIHRVILSTPLKGTNHPHETGFLYLDQEVPNGNLVIGSVRVNAWGSKQNDQWTPTHIKIGDAAPFIPVKDDPQITEHLRTEIRREAQRVKEEMDRQAAKSKTKANIAYQPNIQSDQMRIGGSTPSRGQGSLPRRTRPSGTA